MFKRLRRKLAGAARNKTKRPEVCAATTSLLESTSGASTSSRESLNLLPSDKLMLLPEPKVVAGLGAEINDLSKSESVSHLRPENRLQLDDDGPADTYRRQKVTLQEKKREDSVVKVRKSSWELEERVPSDGPETMRFVTLRKPHSRNHALLLTPFVYRRSQALVHTRQDLRAVESELTTTAAEMQNLVAAKGALEDEDDREVPGAFFDDDGYAAKERRRLLMTTIDKKTNICKAKLEDLEAQRPQLAAELDTLQEQYLDNLERAVRDDLAVLPPTPPTKDRRESFTWWAR